jgi:hypothetical protein
MNKCLNFCVLTAVNQKKFRDRNSRGEYFLLFRRMRSFRSIASSRSSFVRKESVNVGKFRHSSTNVKQLPHTKRTTVSYQPRNNKTQFSRSFSVTKTNFEAKKPASDMKVRTLHHPSKKIRALPKFHSNSKILLQSSLYSSHFPSKRLR